jgi:methylglutamate dehydrogenase subunit D
MPDLRTLPLRNHAKQGRFGADRGEPGVTLAILHPVSFVTVIARAGQAKRVTEILKALRGVRVMGAGPDQYYVQAETMADGKLAADLKAKLGVAASVIDQSHGRVVIRISGPRARYVLAKGTPADLHSDHFPLSHSAMTTMAHVGVHLTRTGKNEFTLSVFRGFSESFWEWLTESAAECGYQVL